MIAAGIVLDGWLIGSAAATSLLAGQGMNLGGWEPGDSDSAATAIGATGLLASSRGPAGDAASRMSGGYLTAMAVALTSGADAALAAASLGAALAGVLARSDLAEGLVLNEIAEASADAAEECYDEAGIDLVDIVNGPDPCPACLALAESNPHEPGLIPVHPHCECAEVPPRR